MAAGVYERLMLCKGSEKELEIVRDLSRTYPSHVYYQQRQGPGQRSLFNVLRAYAIYDRQVASNLPGLFLFHPWNQVAFLMGCACQRIRLERVVRWTDFWWDKRPMVSASRNV